ncbi:SGNH/GDSL hydrolase family protein [Rhodoplanes sp. SY1]|uniref:SGNH/GDSL hydrolase family protein n=1 Tax=Rhodoplanes sp. SY1 TaxID=3166646 RepID=UPI0038B56D6F
MHVVLLGDTVFDPGADVGSSGGVLAALRRVLPAGAAASSLARDGAAIDDLPAQLTRLPADVTHLVVSIGGADAIAALAGVTDPVATVGDSLDRLAAARDRFAGRYAAVADALKATHRPVALCTMWRPSAREDRFARAAGVGIDLLDNAIVRIALARGLALIDLRLVCPGEDDFDLAGTPSARGCAKTASAVVRFVDRTTPAPTVII